MTDKKDYNPLHRNGRTRTPERFMFVDTETYQTPLTSGDTRHDLRLGVARYVEFDNQAAIEFSETVPFISVPVFWDLVEDFVHESLPLHIIAHNISYDMVVLKYSTELSKRVWECTSFYSQHLVFNQTWVMGEKKIYLMDNSNWFTGALANWGEEIGMAKLPMPDPGASHSDWVTYCERDVDILVELTQRFLSTIIKEDLGHWGRTKASCAMRAFRHRFMGKPLNLPQDDKENDFARTAFFGGRTECFWNGKGTKGPYYKLDVNSMYPYVMAKEVYPRQFLGHKDGCSVDVLRRMTERYCVIACVSVNTAQPAFVYPLEKNRLYPVGQFTTMMSSPELVLGLANGWITECHELSWYQPWDVFSKYVKYFYRKRLEAKRSGRTLESAFYKGFLNQLFGKFAQRGYTSNPIGKASLRSAPWRHCYDHDTGKRWSEVQIGENILELEQTGHADTAFPAIAAHVTAWGRIYLYRLIITAFPCNVFYCDTDSLIVNQQGFDYLKPWLHPDNLGALKVEGVADEIEIVAPKEYRFGETWKRKGIRASARQVGDRTFDQEMWPGLSTLARLPDEEYHTYEYSRTNTAGVTTGITQPDKSVRPFRFWQDPTEDAREWEDAEIIWGKNARTGAGLKLEMEFYPINLG